MKRRRNNFDFLRFLFALFVVMSHAYPLSGGDESSLWIYKITNGQIVLAQVGLSGFFVISGYFIFQSMQRSKTILQYIKKRVLRLFPALFVVLLLSISLAPLLYQSDVPYLSNKAMWSYLPNNLSLYGFQAVIPGVFDTNPYHAVNGSLWTIRYEFSLYLWVALLFFIRNKLRLVQIYLIVTFAVMYILFQFYGAQCYGASIFGMQGFHILNLGGFFVFGGVLAAFQFEKFSQNWVVLVSGLGLVLALYFNCYNMVRHVLLSVFILQLGFMPLPFFGRFGIWGDASYGIYIYSFPVQQTLMYYFKMDTLQLMLYSCVISIGFGYMSWHFVEKYALKLKYRHFLFDCR